MEFEFDENKSRSNRLKHGIDFVEAQSLWKDERLLEIPARTTDEPRSMMIGRIGEILWSAVIIHRGPAHSPDLGPTLPHRGDFAL